LPFFFFFFIAAFSFLLYGLPGIGLTSFRQGLGVGVGGTDGVGTTGGVCDKG